MKKIQEEKKTRWIWILAKEWRIYGEEEEEEEKEESHANENEDSPRS